jgi:hypothetical protein
MMSLYPSRAGISCHPHIHPVFYIDLKKKEGVMFERQSMLSKIDDNDNEDRATEVA